MLNWKVFAPALVSNFKKMLVAGAVVMSTMFGSHATFAAQDTSGYHAFFNDDRNQFVDVWLNSSGTVTIKVSNGRPWRPMAVVVHATFKSGDTVVGKQDYHVWCEAPNAGGGGKERWFTFPPPGFPGVTSISVTTNKEAFKDRRGPRDWNPPLPGGGRQ